MAGRVDLMCDALNSSLPLIRSGQLPDVRTLQESGVRDLDVSSWLGLLAPTGTPREIVALLSSEL